MKSFTDEQGNVWSATVSEEAGGDYKGRFYLTLARVGAADHDQVALTDVRWNSRPSAARTLSSMSEVELRRRLRSARGRAGPPRRP